MTPTAPHPFRMDYKRAFIPLNRFWADPQVELTLMQWLTAMLRTPGLAIGGAADTPPFGPRAIGYRWRLDSSNDWWAKVERDTDPQGTLEEPVLIIACRHDNQPLAELAAWVATCVGPRP